MSNVNVNTASRTRYFTVVALLSILCSGNEYSYPALVGVQSQNQSLGNAAAVTGSHKVSVKIIYPSKLTAEIGILDFIYFLIFGFF